MLHAHIVKESRDCDGAYTSGHTMMQTHEEQASEFGDIEFHRRVVAEVVNSYSLMDTGRLFVHRFEDGSTRLVWSEPTDEGYRNTEATLCIDECELPTPWQRDHTAEAAGY